MIYFLEFVAACWLLPKICRIIFGGMFNDGVNKHDR